MDTQNEKQYASLKAELVEIAAILEKYPDAIRPKVFEVLLSAYYGHQPNIPIAPAPVKPAKAVSPAPAPVENPATNLEATKESKAKKKISDTYSIDPELSLHGGKDIPSFIKFVEEKKPSSNYEFNAVAVFYITKILKKSKATLKEAWTCYKEVKRRTPEFFRQSFTDTKNQKGYLKISEEFDLELSGRGENLVEHDLPPKAETPKP